MSIKIQLFSSEEKYSLLSVIFGKSSCPELSQEAYTCVNYHNRNPNFNEEFKLRLPTKINKQTHLLFTFIHVHTKPKSDGTPVDEPVGFTWLPLFRDDCLQTGTFQLPVLAEMPAAGYSNFSPTSLDSMTACKWIDNRKPLFTVHLDSYSSIFAQDAHIDRFFRITSSLDSQEQLGSTLHSTNMYEEFIKAIQGLIQANTDSLVKFVHLILNRLILLMVRPPRMFSNSQMSNSSTKSIQAYIFDTMMAVVGKINGSLYDEYFKMKSGILATFIQYQAVFPQPEVRFNEENGDSSPVSAIENHSGSTDSGISSSSNSIKVTYETMIYTKSHRNGSGNGSKLTDFMFTHSRNVDAPPSQAQKCSVEFVSRSFHEEMLQQLISASESTRDKVFENAHFVFDAIFKSLCVHFSLNNLFSVSPRARLTKSFMNNLNELTRIIAEYIVTVTKKTSNQQESPSLSSQFKETYLITNLNQSFAFFIRDLISIVDRQFVFNLIKIFTCKMSVVMPKSNSFQYATTKPEYSSANNSHNFVDNLFEFRIDFLRIVCGHEHFVALNLPFATPLFTALEQPISQAPGSSSTSFPFSPSSSFAKVMMNSSIFSNSIFDRIRPYAELTDEYRRQHWLVGLVFCTLVDSFTKKKNSLQLKSANLVRFLLTSYDWDVRFKGKHFRLISS